MFRNTLVSVGIQAKNIRSINLSQEKIFFIHPDNKIYFMNEIFSFQIQSHCS